MSTSASGIEVADAAHHRVDGSLLGGVDLVDDDHVGHAQVGLAGVVAPLVTGAERVGHDDVEVGAEERQVVVAAIPDDDVGLLLGLAQDGLVVDAGEDDAPRIEVWLVLLALLDGRVVASRSSRSRSAGPAAPPGRRRAWGGGPRPRRPCSARAAATARVVWLLPDPVRTAQTATTGTRLEEHDLAGPEEAELGARGQGA